MKTVVALLMMLAACSAFARQAPSPPNAQGVAFFDVLDLPARIDEPKLRNAAGKSVLKCALANRSEEPIAGLRLALLLVNSSNTPVAAFVWSEAVDVPAYSIKTLEFHPETMDEIKDGHFFLAIDEVIGRESVWRSVNVRMLLEDYAHGQHSLNPKVQKVQNKFDLNPARVMPARLF